jgi:hypothetical protein
MARLPERLVGRPRFLQRDRADALAGEESAGPVPGGHQERGRRAGEQQFRTRDREEPQDPVDLLAQAAAPDQRDALAEVGVLVDELQGHAAAERVADHRAAPDALDHQQVAQGRRHGPERVVVEVE